MSKNLSAKCCQEYKERLQKRACERYQNLPKEEKNNMVLDVTKISQKMESKSLLTVEINIQLTVSHTNTSAFNI